MVDSRLVCPDQRLQRLFLGGRAATLMLLSTGLQQPFLAGDAGRDG